MRNDVRKLIEIFLEGRRRAVTFCGAGAKIDLIDDDWRVKAMASRAVVPPTEWAISALSGAPVLDRQLSAVVPARVRRWTGIAPEIDQAALDQHFFSFHIGGAKRLYRRGEGGMQTRDVPNAAFSIVPSGAAFEWNTIGPVDFAHFYFAPSAVNDVLSQAFNRDPSTVFLRERLGETDPLVSTLAVSLLQDLDAGDLPQAYLDDILHLLVCRVLRLHSNVGDIGAGSRQSLAPFKLRRAYEFIEESLEKPIGVTDIAGAVGISPYHFSRAFRQATGKPPYAYLLERRIAKAKLLLCEGDKAVALIAQRCGFSSTAQFSRQFHRVLGSTPTAFRNAR